MYGSLSIIRCFLDPNTIDSLKLTVPGWISMWQHPSPVKKAFCFAYFRLWGRVTGRSTQTIPQFSTYHMPALEEWDVYPLGMSLPHIHRMAVDAEAMMEFSCLRNLRCLNAVLPGCMWGSTAIAKFALAAAQCPAMESLGISWVCSCLGRILVKSTATTLTQLLDHHLTELRSRRSGNPVSVHQNIFYPP